MKTKTINVYEFEELKPNIQEEVLNKFREWEDFPFLNDDLEEVLKQELEKNKISFSNLKLYYSLSYCQGDGFCFIGDFETDKGTFRIEHNSRYYYKNSVDVEIISLKVNDEYKDIYDLTKAQEKKADKVLNDFKEVYFNICDDLEKEGYSYMEEVLKDETLKETIKLNEYTFRENGKIENL